MKTVALFGGSFNPPHVAHQLVALYVLETQPVDELWFVPVWQHVFGKDAVPFEDRVKMCEIAAAPLGARAQVSRAEEELAQRPNFQGSRTLDLVEMLRDKHPDVAFRFVVGTDILVEKHKWHRWDDVVAAAPLIVIGRAGHLPAGSVATGVTMPEVASTEVRGMLRQGDQAGLASLLPASVMRYIAARGLYRAEA